MLLFLILGVVEGSARVYELFNPHCIFMEKDAFSKTDFFLSRIICLDHNNRVFEKDTIRLLSPNQHSQTININSHGFRGSEISIEKPNDVFRIFVVGGSTTFGVGSTSDNTTMPGFLQEKFKNSDIDISIDVINAGIGGADSASESYYIKNFLLKFEPDMFVIYDGWNDAINDVQYIEYEDFEEQSNENSDNRFFQFANFPFYRTPFVIYDILFWNPDKISHYVVDPELIPIKTDLWKKRWQNICDSNSKNNIDTVIILQPLLGTGSKTLSPDESLMVPKLNEHKVPLQILDSFSNVLPHLDNHCTKTYDFRNIFDNVNEPVYFDLGHTTDFGNEIIAQNIFNEIYPLVKEKISKTSYT